MKKPNVIFVFADQWRASAFGYAGDTNVQTPNLDYFARHSHNFKNAVASSPVCTPYRATLMTGQFAHEHGLFVNDVPLQPKYPTFGERFKKAGYDTAYIGKWHIDGNGRSNYIPPERRFGFDFWRVLECTHRYNDSLYYHQDETEPRQWEGYDATAQTDELIDYLEDHNQENPFLMLLSWGPPHAPYDTAPEKYKNMYQPADIELPPNVPAEKAEWSKETLAGYYAHCTALDDQWQRIVDKVNDLGIAEDTILVFRSDHGDMIGSQGEEKKQRPWTESLNVPFLLQYPKLKPAAEYESVFNSVDILPTLLGLCDIDQGEGISGLDYSTYLKGTGALDPKAQGALIQCVSPFGQYTREGYGGKEFRGLRTTRYTYVKDLQGGWLLYDNQEDPFQLINQIHNPDYADIIKKLNEDLVDELALHNDEFKDGWYYIHKWGYITDDEGTVGFEW